MFDSLIVRAAADNRVLGGLLRGLGRKCPACAQGRLYARYLKVEPTCAACGHDNAQYRADDAGPYFTILVVGHIAIGPMLIFPFIWQAPLWLVLGLTLPTLAALTLVLLPIVKGGVIGVQWAIHGGKDAPAPGDEAAADEAQLEAA